MIWVDLGGGTGVSMSDLQSLPKATARTWRVDSYQPRLQQLLVLL